MPTTEVRGLPRWAIALLTGGALVALALGAATLVYFSPAAVTRRLQRIRHTVSHWDGRTDRLVTASMELRLILQVYPRDARAWVETARIVGRSGYLQRDEYRPGALEAEMEIVERALAIDPKSFEAHLARGSLLVHRKDLEGARREADRAASLRPDSREVELARAEIALAEKDWEGARHHAATARLMAGTEAERADSEPFLQTAYQGLGRFDLAESSYVSRLRAAPGAAWGHVNYASFLVRRKRPDEAIREAETALGIMEFGMGHRVLAEAWAAKGIDQLWRSGQAEESVASFDCALAADSSLAEAWYGRAMAVWHARGASGDVAAVDRIGHDLRRALECDPGHDRARLAFAQWQTWSAEVAAWQSRRTARTTAR